MKIALGVQYDGKEYYGWQKQYRLPNIQDYVENALSLVANEPIKVVCAGRTDAGVHATGQVLHFTTCVHRSYNAWIKGANYYLPKDIAVTWCKLVDNDFHARFSALSRRYFYIIYNHSLRPAVFYKGFTYCKFYLNIKKMRFASKFLIGENDFSSFRSTDCQSNTPWRCIYHLHIENRRNFIIFDIKANSFLQHMVRNIIGSLLEVGYNRKPEDWIFEILSKKNRSFVKTPTVPPDGLYLAEVKYPKKFDLPNYSIRFPVFI